MTEINNLHYIITAKYSKQTHLPTTPYTLVDKQIVKRNVPINH